MTDKEIKNDPIKLLIAARMVADFAHSEGFYHSESSKRIYYRHIGAVLADSILQAGVNYSTVVLPRVQEIFKSYPSATRVVDLRKILQTIGADVFLQWTHHEKIARFERLVEFIFHTGINDADDLRCNLQRDDFCCLLQNLNGIGPKTVDYMSCLVGIESIAVDRHIRSFAKRVGIESTEYQYLKKVFCYAADLLSASRREFDRWVWSQEAFKTKKQLVLL